nr:hypothetical protein CFP56_33500 [Quercus suber]
MAIKTCSNVEHSLLQAPSRQRFGINYMLSATASRLFQECHAAATIGTSVAGYELIRSGSRIILYVISGDISVLCFQACLVPSTVETAASTSSSEVDASRNSWRRSVKQSVKHRLEPKLCTTTLLVNRSEALAGKVWSSGKPAGNCDKISLCSSMVKAFSDLSEQSVPRDLFHCARNASEKARMLRLERNLNLGFIPAVVLPICPRTRTADNQIDDE